MAKETAEQKLLKVIETTESGQESKEGDAKAAEPAAGADAAAQAAASSVKGTGVSISMPPFLDSFLSILRGLKPSDKSAAAFGLRDVNHIMAISIVAISLYFLFDFVKGINYSRRDIRFEIDVNPSSVPQNVLFDFKDISEYLANMAERNIFQPFEEKKVEEIDMLPPETRRITERTQNLKLVGISWVDTPESASALIENTDSTVTHFLKMGETINSVEVKQIYRESVILSYQGEELELSL